MNLLSWINTDVFAAYRDKVNAIVSGLKEGGVGKILVANGVAVNPVWTDQWTLWTTISGGNTNGWFFSGTSPVKWRKNNLDGRIQLIGQMTGSGDKHGAFEPILTLPGAIVPSVEQFRSCAGRGTAPVKVTIDVSTSKIFVSVSSDIESSYYVDFGLIEYYL